jgi:hypothetical protein
MVPWWGSMVGFHLGFECSPGPFRCVKKTKKKEKNKKNKNRKEKNIEVRLTTTAKNTRARATRVQDP